MIIASNSILLATAVYIMIYIKKLLEKMIQIA